MANLPADLRYLDLALEDLAAADPNEINEDFDASLICSALKQRIAGLDDTTAIAALQADKLLLDRWIANNPESQGHFLSAFISTPDELVPYLRRYKPKRRKAARPKRPRARLAMSSPDGFSCRTGGGGLFFECGPIRYGLSTMRSISQRELRHLASGDFPVKVLPVSYGDVRGYRVVIEGSTRSFALRLDGKDITVYVDGDPAPLESVLHTLHYTLDSAAN